MSKEHTTVALVTGATGEIGKAIACQLAARPGYEIVLVCRSERKGDAAAAHVRRTTGNERVRCVHADLSRRASVQSLADAWESPVHALVNDAGVTPPRREETPEGIELTFATNVLGYLWMIEAFGPHLAPGARIVNVASYWAGDLDVDDLEFRRRRYHNHPAYRQSKQANRMLTVAHAERLREAGVSVNACHPGDVRSRLSRNLGFHNPEPPESAARTPVALATGELGAGTSGKYFERGREIHCRFARDVEAVERLYDRCRSYA